MASPLFPKPVKLILATLDGDEAVAAQARTRLCTAFGEIDFVSARFPFAATDYYVREMGKPLYRQFYAFTGLISPEALPGIKMRTHALENELAVAGKRRVNLDPGYLDTDKLVLASAKYHGNKIYLGQGIWADMTLHYEKGKFTALPWSFPDFRSGLYEQTFLRIREVYKKQLKERAAPVPA
ncbi:MAG: DUF4416 family protein [bacterium]